MKKILLMFVFLISAITVFSQTEIKGTITDDSGVPIAGANIIIKGSASGTNSDFDGNYNFSTSLTGSQILEVSYLGYLTYEKQITLDETTLTIHITLADGGSALDAVVLTATSTKRSQKETPMSITSIGAKKLAKINH